MNAQEIIATQSSYCAIVLQKGEQFAFVQLGTDTCVHEGLALVQRGYRFVLVVGVMAGRIVSAEYMPASKGDAVSWLENLHRLEDARPHTSSIGCSEGCSESDSLA